MTEILNILKSGTPREKLGVIADLFGIVGISLAAIVGGLLSLGKSVKTVNLVVAIAYSLLCFGGSVIALVIFLMITGFIKVRFTSNPHLRYMILISLWAFLAAAFLIASIYYFEIINSFEIFVHEKA